MPEFVARFGKFNYGIFAFNSLTPDILRRITRKFIDDKLQYFKNIREHAKGRFLTPPNLIVSGYSDDVVEYALQQTNTTKNGAREIRDIVDRMLNAVYNQALTDNPMNQDIVAEIELNSNGIPEIRR